MCIADAIHKRGPGASRMLLPGPCRCSASFEPVISVVIHLCFEEVTIGKFEQKSPVQIEIYFDQEHTVTEGACTYIMWPAVPGMR